MNDLGASPGCPLCEGVGGLTFHGFQSLDKAD
jgi:hypothetical protein